MKRAVLLTLLTSGFVTTHAQWSNTKNQFYDSLGMPVARAASDQKNSLVVKSEPDGGTLQMDADISALAPGMYIMRYGNTNMKVVN